MRYVTLLKTPLMMATTAHTCKHLRAPVTTVTENADRSISLILTVELSFNGSSLGVA